MAQDSTKKILAIRFKKASLRWHVDHLREQLGETYKEWKNTHKEHFKHPADQSKQNPTIFSVRQRSKPTIKTLYIDKIINVYNSIYKYFGNANEDSNHELTPLKDDILIQMFIDGLQPPIKMILLNNKYPSTLNWNNIVKLK